MTKETASVLPWSYLHGSCEFESYSGDTTLCEKVCQWLTGGRWFSPDTPISSTNKTGSHDITEILLKVALNTINIISFAIINFPPKDSYIPTITETSYCVSFLGMFYERRLA